MLFFKEDELDKYKKLMQERVQTAQQNSYGATIANNQATLDYKNESLARQLGYKLTSGVGVSSYDPNVDAVFSQLSIANPEQLLTEYNITPEDIGKIVDYAVNNNDFSIFGKEDFFKDALGEIGLEDEDLINALWNVRGDLEKLATSTMDLRDANNNLRKK